MDNKDIFTDKKVFGDILVDIDNATSLREHVKQNIDFYRANRILNGGVQFTKDPINDITEQVFIRYWMSKVDYKQDAM